MTRAITTSPEAMTPEWFRHVLSQAGLTAATTIEDVALEPVGGGVIARMVRAHLTYATTVDAPKSVVVKFPTDDEGSFGLAQSMRMYELEVRFYQDIAPFLGDVSIPTCYHADLDDESGRFVLVLEDLADRTRAGDVLTECTPDECAMALEELVKLQAPLWNSRTLDTLEWFADPHRIRATFDALPSGLEPFLTRFGDKLAADHVKLFESTLPHAGEWVRRWTAPTVVQHGDFRTDNLLFGADSTAPPLTIIDFQTVRPAPPGLDPAYFLGSSLSTATRRSVERDLIVEYHEKLMAAGVSDFDFNSCWSAYREGAMYGVFLFVGMASQVESTERGDRLIVDQIGRYADMAIDLDAPSAAGLL